ncbi:MAG: hypothetical protein CSB24_06135 [Deltaproteobacteria bacterium]|nr:MAG: hypothetical protein CSB24_06135 [Deltaproteobacteria bacterium]
MFLLFFCAVQVQASDDPARLGGGVTYWRTIDDIDQDDEVDDDGFSFYASYQYWGGLLGVEADLEFLPDKVGEDTFAPQAFLLVGRGIYAGAGIGIEYRDGEFADEPFFALRAGLNLEVLPSIYWDIYGLYRFNDSAELDDDNTDIDTDTVFLGTAVRFGF